MIIADKPAFKRAIRDACVLILRERIRTIHDAMADSQESANSEDKSSAGDKYEVGRAMGHLQQEMLADQLRKAEDELALLNSLNTDISCKEVTKGAVVEGGDLILFIALGLGNIIVAGYKVVVLSPIAPLAISLQHKQKGDTFTMNKIKFQITDIF
jgi:hypothetical protein